MAASKKEVHQLSEKTFQALIENSHEGIVVYDHEGRIKFASKSVSNLTGYGKKAILGKNGKAFLHPEDVEESKKIFYKVLQKPGRSENFFQRIRHKRGHYFWSESRLTNFTNIPEINGIVSNFRDVTESKIAEEQVRQSRQLLETINQNLTEGIYMGIIGEKFIYVNEPFLKMFGYKNFKEIEKIKPARVYANASERKKIVNTLLKSKKLVGAETLFRKKDGSTFWGILNASLVKQTGKKVYFVGSISNISQEKEVASELIESRNFLNNIINTVAAPIFVKDQKHRWVLFNKYFADLIGKTHHEILGKSDFDYLEEKEAKIFRKIDREVLRTGKTIINYERFTSVNGKVNDLLTVKSRYCNERNEKFIIGFCANITHLKQVEEKINQLNANLRGVLESTQDHILAVDQKFRYVTFNRSHARSFKKLFNVDIKSGMSMLSFLPSQLKKVAAEQIGKALKGEHVIIEEQWVKNVIFEVSISPIRKDPGNITGAALFARDVTQRKVIEEKMRQLNDELTQQNIQLANQEEALKATLSQLSEKNFELDQLMYKTSHDLRSPLSSIMGLVNLAAMDQDPVNTKEYLAKIDGRIKKLDEFIKSMLNYARVNRVDLSPERINLKEITQMCVRELEYLENFNAIQILLVCDEGEIIVSDPLRIRIIFSNIISNAYKYYNADVRSYLKIEIHKNVQGVHIVFTDNGIGIKAEHMDKIFNMFYRATERSQGSGLGMYIVKQAVEKLKGRIMLKSEYGKGTKISITLPGVLK